MGLVADKCPECGARVQVEADREEARCEYCAATFRIGAAARTGGSPQTMAARKGAILAARLGVPQDELPKVLAQRQRRPLAAIVVLLVVLGTVAAIVAFTVVPAVKQAAGVAESLAPGAPGAPSGPAKGDAPSWLGHTQPILADVNGDGLADPIGWGRYYRQPGTPQHLVALDAKTGTRLWQSDPFSPDSWTDIKVTRVGDRLIVGDTAGLLRAIALENGRTVWSAPVGERVDRACRLTEDGLVLYLKDRRAIEVAVATGSLTPRGQADPKAAECQPLETNEERESPTVRLDAPPFRHGHLVRIEGQETSHVLQAVGSRLAFALGTKSPGTAVPMVAAFHPAEHPPEEHGPTTYTPVWRSAIAGATTMAVDPRAPEFAWFADGRLFVPYRTSGEAAAEHLACLDAESGRSVFDVDLEGIEAGRAWGVAGANGRLYISHGDGLDAYDAANGAHLLHLSD